MLDRRQFLVRGTAAGIGFALAQVPALLRALAWGDASYAQAPELVTDTFNGLVAFVFPGDDAYSRAQGDATREPGGIAGGATPVLIHALDHFVPAPDVPRPNDATMPLSAAIANLLNAVAARVDPAAAAGPFPSHFARLRLREKIEVFRVLEEEAGRLLPGALPAPFSQSSGDFRFVVAVIPAFATFVAYCEAGVFDPVTRALRALPSGWRLSGYQGGRTTPVEGWDELLGYYRGRREVSAR